MNQLLNPLSFNRYPKGPTHKRTDIQTHRKVLHGQYLLLLRNSPNHSLSFLTIHCHSNVSIEILTADIQPPFLGQHSHNSFSPRANRSLDPTATPTCSSKKSMVQDTRDCRSDDLNKMLDLEEHGFRRSNK